MKWDEAVEAMRDGKWVRRVSESVQQLVGGRGDMPISCTGREPRRLMVVMTADGDYVSAHFGAWSRVPSEPDDEDMQADDWIVVQED